MFHTRLSKTEFFDFVQESLPCFNNRNAISKSAQCLLFKMRICHNVKFRLLASHFCIDKMTAVGIFTRLVLYHFRHSCNIPVILNEQGQINQPELDKLLETSYQAMPRFCRRVASKMKDPTGRNRRGVILQCDSTYFDTTSSSDNGKFSSCVF